MKKPVPVESASALIDEKIKELGDWRGNSLARVRDDGAVSGQLAHSGGARFRYDTTVSDLRSAHRPHPISEAVMD
jgi:hypothetical protein